MNASQPSVTKNLDAYGNEAMPWSRAVAALQLTGGPDITWFLGVVDAGGSPHAAGVGALWSEGGLYFVSGPGTRLSIHW